MTADIDRAGGTDQAGGSGGVGGTKGSDIDDDRSGRPGRPRSQWRLVALVLTPIVLFAVVLASGLGRDPRALPSELIGRASCRERVSDTV